MLPRPLINELQQLVRRGADGAVELSRGAERLEHALVCADAVENAVTALDGDLCAQL